MDILFWILFFSIVYSYLVYPIILILALSFKIKNKGIVEPSINYDKLPTVALLIAAYNEVDVVDDKVENSQKLNYPTDKLKIYWVTDGSDDGTVEKLMKYSDVQVLHKPERKGKINAINRAVKKINSEIIVFCDANTILNKDTLLHIAKHFLNPNVGCVAGEKQIISENMSASGTGEGLYWRYESLLKKLDAKFNVVLGAAGELFAVRKNLYTTVDKDTILDDFVISLRIVLNGYKLIYEPKATAGEFPSTTVNEEMKRKVRIAAGGFQVLSKHKELMNVFKHPKLAFQFVSHKVFRWLICPFALILIIPVNIFMVYQYPFIIYLVILITQIVAYLLVIIGFVFEKLNIANRFVTLPYYFLTTNISQIRGLFRYLNNKQKVTWERSKRMSK